MCPLKKKKPIKKAPTWKSSLPWAVLLCVVVLSVFYSVLHFGFVNWDDETNFIVNPWVKGKFDVSHLTWAWTTRHLDVYQPISWILLQLQYAVAPQNPAPLIHFVSLLLHVANSLITFVLFLKLFHLKGTKESIIAFCGALFFALHPMQCETVIWASCQPYLLSIMWAGLSVLCFLKALEPSEGRGWYRLSIALFALSLLSKSISVSLPAVLILLRMTKDRSEKVTYRTFVQDWPFWLLSVCDFGMALWSRSQIPKGGVTSWLGTVRLVPAYLGFYTEKIFVPTGFSLIYDPSIATGMEIALGISLVAATIFCLGRTKQRPLGVLLLTVIFLLLPGIAASRTEGTLFADRYGYVPNVALGIILSICIAHFPFPKSNPKSVFFPLLCALFLGVGLAIASSSPIDLWSDPARLWQSAIDNGAEASPKAHYNLGNALAAQGDLDSAITSYQKALEIKPDHLGAYNNLGITLGRQGKFQAASVYLRKALEIEPDNAAAHSNLGLALANLGQIDEAVVHYTRALELEPSAETENNLGLALASRGQIAEAVSHYQKAQALDPDFPDTRRNLAAALEKQKRQ